MIGKLAINPRTNRILNAETIKILAPIQVRVDLF